jgi:hypothetical protein
MQTLYDSETFAVIHVPGPKTAPSSSDTKEAAATATVELTNTHGESAYASLRDGFQILDKKNRKEIYLDGPGAEFFQRQIASWQKTPPTQEEVEDILASCAVFAQTPIQIH